MLERQTQVELYEIEDILAYIVSMKPSGLHSEAVSKGGNLAFKIIHIYHLTHFLPEDE